MWTNALNGFSRRFLLLTVIAAVGFAGPAGARTVTWGPPEPVESGAADLSSPAGSTAVWRDDAWHIVYPRNGGVRYAWRDAGGWHLGPMLAAEGSTARDPHLGDCADGLIAVWSASSQPAREIFVRRGSRQNWGEAEVLSADGILSQAPVVSGCAGQPRALVAWEDSSAAGFRVRGRTLSALGWSSVAAISTADADAREPSLTANPTLDRDGEDLWFVAWSDWRDGEPEIYRRGYRDSWGTEERLTALTQGCRHPCLLRAVSGDPPLVRPFVAFEAAGPAGGATEIWTAQGYSPPSILSPDDGVNSSGVSSAGFWDINHRCRSLPTWETRCRVAWTDDAPSGSLLRSSWPGPPAGGARDSIASAVVSRVALGARPGTPTAALLQVWVELVAGQPTVMAREGTTAGCMSEALIAPTPVVLGPQGDPPTRLRVQNNCDGEGEWGFVELRIDQGLAGQLTFAAGQQLWMDGETGEDGWIEFPILGGGCAASGYSHATAGPSCDIQIQGAKSPDVNGDCLVGADDRAYVVSWLGTADFCADLDGSGLVDNADLAVVDATMGDQCLAAAALPEGGSGDGSIHDLRDVWLSARPNPATSATRLVLEGAAGLAGPMNLMILDAAGREVRRLELQSPCQDASVGWDLRNGEGREVPAGCYFVAMETPGGMKRTTLLVIR